MKRLEKELHVLESYMFTHNSYEDSDSVIIGNGDLSKALKIPCLCEEIWRIESDEKLDLYVFQFVYFSDSVYRIYAQKSDGSFVKYIDTNEIAKAYFEEDLSQVLRRYNFNLVSRLTSVSKR